MRIFSVPVVHGRPADSPPVNFTDRPVSHGLLVVFTFAVYVTVIYLYGTLRSKRLRTLGVRD